MTRPEVWFLLIDGGRDHWGRVAQATLGCIGAVDVGSEQEAIALVMKRRYDMIVIDAGAVAELPLLICRIRAQRPDARVVVATLSPTWKRAREAFRAGATDYIHKTLNRQDLLSTLKSALQKTPPCGRR